MSGRIALMVRGLPSIGIDEAVERFGKYYPEAKSATFHTSPSFEGNIRENSVDFSNQKTGDFKGGQGLNAQAISDLRKLQKDFNSFTTENPGIYTNEPTSASRAKLYKRIGFQQDPNSMAQVIDTRRIAEDDLPYVKAIDSAVYSGMVKDVLRPDILPAFLGAEGNVIAGSRINGNRILDTLRGYDNSVKVLGNELTTAFVDKKAAKRRIGYDEEGQLIDRQRFSMPSWNPSVSAQNYQGIVDTYDDIPF